MWVSRHTTIAGGLDERFLAAHPPRALGVELTTHCAFRCVHCPKGQSSYSRPQGHMSEATLRVLLDQAGALDLNEVSLSNDGDVSSLPTEMLVGHLGLIDAALPREVLLTVISNLAGFTEAGMRAIASLQRPLKVVIDLYGARPETVTRVTSYPRPDEIHEKARFFLRLLAAREQPTETRTHAFRNELSPEEQREFLLAWQDACPGHQVDLNDLYAYPAMDLSGLGVPRVPGSVTRYPCVHPFEGWNVNYDGTVPICCLACGFDRMGDIHEESLSAIWQGERFTALRRKLLVNDLDGLPCLRCDNWYFSTRRFFRPRQFLACLREWRNKLRAR